MTNWLIASHLATLSGSLVLLLVYATLCRRNRDRHMGLWAGAWAVYGLGQAASLATVLWPASPLPGPVLQTCMVVTGWLLVAGAGAFAKRPLAAAWTWLAMAGCVWAIVAGMLGFERLWGELFPFAYHAAAAVATGILVLRSVGGDRLGRILTGGAFILWGLDKFDYPLLHRFPAFAPLEYLFGSLFCFAAGGGMLLIYFQQILSERDRSRDYYRTLLETVPLGIAECNGEGRILFANGAYCRMHGVAAGGLNGKSMIDLGGSDEVREEIRQRIATIRREESAPNPFVMANLGPGGEKLYRRIDWNYLRSPRAENRGLLFVVSDITESKRLEHDLRSQGQFLQNLLDAIPAPLFFKDTAGVYLGCNRAFEEMLGRGREEIVHRTVFDLAPSELAAVYHIADNELIVRQGTQVYETEVLFGDGRQHTVIFHKATFPACAGHPAGLVGTMLDISPRKEMERELAEKQASLLNVTHQLQTLLDTLSDPLVLLAPDLTIQWMNRGAREAFGGSGEAGCPTHCFKTWRNRPIPCDPCPAMESFTSGQPASMRIEMAEHQVWDVRSFPLSGDAPRVILHLTDVTEKVQIQKDTLRQAQLASLGELSAGVAHEINNPINGIINYAEMLGDTLAADSPENELARRIVKESERIATIVRNLLSFARESGEEKHPASLYEILLDAFVLVEAQFRRSGVDLTMNVAENLPAVLANPQQVQQVFLNVLGNALYALNQKEATGAPGKTLEISAQRIERNGRLFVRIVFFDRGLGIPAAVVDKVMNPFFTTKPAGKGTGLGLSISHGIVRDHDGRLTIDSRENEWTRVAIELPAA